MFWLIFLVNFLNVYGQYHGKKFECSPIIIPMCLDIPYNTTRMPNLLQHGTQEEAAITAHEFKPLVNIKCSPYVRFFILFRLRSDVHRESSLRADFLSLRLYCS
ncbi:Frizzled-7-B [Armadillidium vulgare]|nr:Frizzled-7-B [Armadillidium vulgare]